MGTPTIIPHDRITAQRRTLRIAWLTLFVFFALFLTIVTMVVLSLRQWYLTVTDAHQAVLIVRSSNESIVWQPAGRTIFQGTRDQQELGEGDVLRALPNAGYGQVASLRLFEGSQLDLWAGAELRLVELRTTRWHSGTLQITLEQTGGYIRYDLRGDQSFQTVRFTVLVGDTRVELLPGGSYSIGLFPPERRVIRVDDRPALVADVAVRSGRATVTGVVGQAVRLTAGQRIEIDPAGLPGLPVPARWELIRDGGFSRFSEVEYNNTTRTDDPTLTRATTWQVSGTPSLPLAERGFFRLAAICRPPNETLVCRPEDWRTAAWFYRVGGQVNGFVTSIRQNLGVQGTGVDVSEFRSLVFSLWARVDYQSLPAAGDRGTECPVMIRIVARRTSPTDPDEERVVCIYTAASDDALRVRADGVFYVRIEPSKWSQFRVDLRDSGWLPDYRYLRSVEIYANGHDYDSRVAEVSLIGTQ
ncbi:hypothetical protein [Chloroflexus aggregans]|uniref:FecR protein domain-containing protein n=1 Tax=Chloroflexus aggregans (strain MD-66 / DSM 9485) TaxID=326427 RepID=B8G839_CHLAD|nr:hypothetical protein [Chloroflexus aggregans]ACL26093.1 conserved hypothetical protein [Chloroflexus aggregans DSM 9485]